MRFILLAISLLFASNTYAAITNSSYIYSDDSDREKESKERLKMAEDNLLKQYLRIFKINREANYGDYNKDEVVYRVGDFSKKDVGAKIGMTKEQVLNNSYWGKPDNSFIDVNMDNKIEVWAYEVYENGRQQPINLLFFINEKLTHIVN